MEKRSKSKSKSKKKGLDMMLEEGKKKKIQRQKPAYYYNFPRKDISKIRRKTVSKANSRLQQEIAKTIEQEEQCYDYVFEQTKKVSFNETINKTYMVQRWIEVEIQTSPDNSEDEEYSPPHRKSRTK